jgi:hypothetical protein
VLWLSGMTGHRYLAKLVAAEIAAAVAFAPDLLFTEMDPGAFLLARIAGIPLASTYASVMRLGIGSRPWRRFSASMRRILAQRGVTDGMPDGLFEDSRVLKLIPSVPELEDDIPDRPEYVFTGSLLGSFRPPAAEDVALDDATRYVFAYLGTDSVPLGTMTRVLPEVFPAGCGTVCLAAVQGFAGELRLGNVVFCPYFDAERVLPRSDWVICHSGHNTIVQSLVNGVPLIVFPGPIFERRFNARKVQEAGAGVFAELTAFRADSLRDIMATREAHARRAGELGKRIISLGGPDTSLKAMERHAGGRGMKTPAIEKPMGETRRPDAKEKPGAGRRCGASESPKSSADEQVREFERTFCGCWEW